MCWTFYKCQIFNRVVDFWHKIVYHFVQCDYTTSLVHECVNTYATYTSICMYVMHICVSANKISCIHSDGL